jgi:hypothetical protein
MALSKNDTKGNFNFGNVIGFLFLIVSVFLFGLKGMSVEMGIAVAASFVFLAFINIDKFSEFKGAGFEAKLKQAVLEANATIENLKEVANPLIKTNLATLTHQGRLSDHAFNKKHDLYDQLIELQTKMGIESKELDVSKKNYLNIHAWDMVAELAGNVEKTGIKDFSKTISEEIGRHTFEKAPNFNRFNDLIKNVPIDDNCKEQLSILENFYFKYKI